MDIEPSPRSKLPHKKPPLPSLLPLPCHKIKLNAPRESFLSASSTDIDSSFLEGSHKFLEKFKRKKESILPISQRCLDFLNKEEEKENESLFNNNFEEEKKPIGKGQFSKVYKVLHKQDKKFYAIKITNHTIKNVKPGGQLQNEAKILAALSVLYEGKNIVRYYNSWMEKKDFYLQVIFQRKE
jgi:Protein kinase domain